MIKNIFNKIFSNQDSDSNKKNSSSKKRGGSSFKKRNNFSGPPKKSKRQYGKSKKTTDKSKDGNSFPSRKKNAHPKRGTSEKKWEATYEDGEVASELVAKHEPAEQRRGLKKRGDEKKSLHQNKNRKRTHGEKWRNPKKQDTEHSHFSKPQQNQFSDVDSDVDRNLQEQTELAVGKDIEKDIGKDAARDKDFAHDGNADDFRKLGVVDEKLLNALNALRLTKAMPVQKSVLPLAMKDCNLVCSSPTGSGKTLSFVLPILQKRSQQKMYQVVVLSPTREIAMQSKKVFEDLLGAEEAEKNVGLVIGGTDMLEQKQILRRYPSIIIATPGRLVDMSRQGLVWLNYTNILVIDEMDRMFDLGFEDDVEQIFKELRKNDHHELQQSSETEETVETKEPSYISGDLKVWMFTATLLPSIERIIDKYVPSYETVIIDQKMKINENIDHCMIFVKHGSKFDLLKKMLKHCFLEKIIIFFNTIDDTLGYTSKLQKAGFKNCVALHSKKSQRDRDMALDDFRSGKKTVLFATDIAARGIDVPEVGLVINFSIPRNPEEYVHRIGRTGRAHSAGRAITLVDDRDKKNLKKLENVVKVRFRTETLEEFMKN